MKEANKTNTTSIIKKEGYTMNEKIAKFRKQALTTNNNNNIYELLPRYTKMYLDNGYTLEKAEKLARHDISRLTSNENMPQLHDMYSLEKTSKVIDISGHNTTHFNKLSFTRIKYYSIDKFISNEYEIITKHIIKTLCYTSVITKAGVYIYPLYDSLIQVIKNGYNDSFFEDIKQEVAIILLENKNLFNIVEMHENALNNTWLCVYEMDFILWRKCFAHVRNYIYNNKQKIDNKEVAIIDYDTEAGEDITININNDFRITTTKLFNDCNIDFISFQKRLEFYDITDNIEKYIFNYYPIKTIDKMIKCFRMLYTGYTKKQIAKTLQCSTKTIENYHKEIIYIYDKLYHHHATTKQYIYKYIDNNKNPFNNYHTSDAYNCMKIIEIRQHSEKQKLYNSLWGVTSEDNKPTCNNSTFNKHLYNQIMITIKCAKKYTPLRLEKH